MRRIFLLLACMAGMVEGKYLVSPELPSDPAYRPVNLLKPFAVTTKTLDAAAVVNRSPQVGIPCTGHGFVVGDVVTISGTTNYNRSFTIAAITNANEFTIVASYVAETLTSAAKITYSIKPLLVENAIQNATWIPQTNTTYYTPSTTANVTEFIGGRHFYGMKWTIPAKTADDSKPSLILNIQPTAIDVRNTVITLRYYTDRPYYAYGTSNYHQAFLFFVSSGGNLTKGSKVSIPLAAGWQEVNIPLSQLVYMASPNTTDWSAVNTFAFSYISHATTDQPEFNVYVEDVTVRQTGRTKGAFMFTFDDAYVAHRTIAAPKLAANGFRSICYMEGNTIGVGGAAARMTLDQARECQAMGMLMACHWSGATFGTTDADKATMATETTVRQWCEGIKSSMYAMGFYEGADYLALPGGTNYIQSESHIQIMREYFAHIRGTTPWRRMGPYSAISSGTLNTAPQNNIYKMTQPIVSSEPWWGDCTQITSGVNFQTNMQAYVDALCEYKDLGVMMIHNIETNGAIGDAASSGYDLNKAQFDAMVDYVKTKVDAGLMEVVTWQDLISVQMDGARKQKVIFSN